MFRRGPSRENKKPCPKPQGLEPLYLICRKCLCVVVEGVGPVMHLKTTTEETSLIAATKWFKSFPSTEQD